MKDGLTLLIIEPERKTLENRSAIDDHFDVAKTRNALLGAGAKIHQDNGGRLLVVEASDQLQSSIREQLRNVRFVPVDEELGKLRFGGNESESLFVKALVLRASSEFKERKRDRRFGETPEEREMFSAPDVAPEVAALENDFESP